MVKRFMATITLKDIPEDLHALLKAEADANFRSLTQEALARIDRSFAFDEQLSAETVNRLMDESIASGPEEKFSRTKFEAAIQSARKKFAARRKAK